MVGALDGDATAHAALLNALVPLLRAFFHRRIGGGDIEDLVQEVLIAVHTRRATYDRDQRFTAWLFAIARYKMIDAFRKSRRFTSMESLEDILAVEGFETASNARIDVDRLLGTLPPNRAKRGAAGRPAGTAADAQHCRALRHFARYPSLRGHDGADREARSYR